MYRDLLGSIINIGVDGSFAFMRVVRLIFSSAALLKLIQSSYLDIII